MTGHAGMWNPPPASGTCALTQLHQSAAVSIRLFACAKGHIGGGGRMEQRCQCWWWMPWLQGEFFFFLFLRLLSKESRRLWICVCPSFLSSILFYIRDFRVTFRSRRKVTVSSNTESAPALNSRQQCFCFWRHAQNMLSTGSQHVASCTAAVSADSWLAS